MQRVIATKNGEVRLFLYLMFDEKLTSNIMFFNEIIWDNNISKRSFNNLFRIHEDQRIKYIGF